MPLGPLDPGYSPYSPYEYTDPPVYAGPIGSIQPLPENVSEPEPEPEPCDSPDGYCPEDYAFNVDDRGNTIVGTPGSFLGGARLIGEKMNTFFKSIPGALTRIFYTALLFLAVGVVVFYFLKGRASRL